MGVNNEDRSPVTIHSCDAAPTPTGFAEIVSDDFPLLHALGVGPLRLFGYNCGRCLRDMRSPRATSRAFCARAESCCPKFCADRSFFHPLSASVFDWGLIVHGLQSAFHGNDKMRITKLLVATTLMLSTCPAYAEPDERQPEGGKFNEYGALIKAVPHERLRIWPIGDKTGMELLVKRGTTDEQLAMLVRWYVSQGNATHIVVFDIPHTPPGGGGNGVMAYYDGKPTPTLIRFLYRHSDEEDLIGQRTIELSPQKTE